MNYRAEIDGLRAIAVIPVIFFHAGLASFGGGFIGVDVFFVISGYLITTIILAEQERGTFSLANFYERRARRILPALFLVMAVSLPFAYAWLLPPDLKSFSQSLIAISTFTSNIYFWQTTGYWGAGNEWIPMLHTWSLAVEEQYYFIFPLLLMLAWRHGRRWLLGSVLAISAISLLGSEWATHQDPVANFFLLPTRAWELGIGATIAFYLLYRKPVMRNHPARRVAAEALGLAGLAMIAFAVHAFDGTVPFPGFHALIPTLGAGLIILCASPQTLVGRLLGTKMLTGIGLISYSAYLWHQPLFAFARHRSLHEPSPWLFALLALLAFLLAYCSWRYVETPFRKTGKWDRRAVFSFAGTGLGLFLAIGIVGNAADGFVSRTTSSGVTLATLKDKLKVNFGLSAACEGSFTLAAQCRTSDEPEILVWGDSYAMHLVQGILASKPDAKIIQMTKSVCGPFFDIALIANPQQPLSWSEGCLEFSSRVRDWLRSNDTVKYVVLSANYENYFARRNALLLRSGEVVDTDIGVLEQALLNTLEELRAMGRSPVVFSPLPSTRDDLGRCLGRARWLGIDLEACSFPVTDISRSRQLVYGLLDGIEQKYPVVRLDELLCGDGMCRANLGPIFIYRDSGHFSREGSAAVGSERGFYHAIVNSTQSMAVTP